MGGIAPSWPISAAVSEAHQNQAIRHSGRICLSKRGGLGESEGEGRAYITRRG